MNNYNSKSTGNSDGLRADMLFDAASTALCGALERNKYLRASKSGFTMILHTWNQQMMFHPHVHIIDSVASSGSSYALRGCLSTVCLAPASGARPCPEQDSMLQATIGR